ncbi:lipoamide acyltransferase component of branched-chain alpha-keto acid dehydrogenase complex, mitochondrial [Lactuca sativa]|uniref:lipoamide acyltransferase component of branched-chain alpha-keto acid dehydrogenase complex, mitochondrial n=1 Tax=Lactuca sativa TaxID=4236 RepID=UPI001C68D045|nr:lipoamide acyltransferase component of branched-chain alpha-keto acid dehydrogenase complex, mitochondrial [Lactuca sativa]
MSNKSIIGEGDERLPNGLNKLYNVKGHYFSSNAEDSQHAGGIIDVPLAQTGEGIAECELLKWFVQDSVGETLLQLVVEDSAVPFNDSDASVVSDGSKFDEHKLELRKSHANDNLSTPVVRSLAKQHGIDLADVTGSGKHGRILKEDVLKYGVEKGIVDDKPAFNPTSIEPMSGPEEQLQEMVESLYHDKIFSQRAYQRAMVRSMTTAASVPHFHYVEEINCDGLMKLKSTFQKENTDLDIKFTFLPMLINSLSSVHLCCKLIF